MKNEIKLFIYLGAMVFFTALMALSVFIGNMPIFVIAVLGLGIAVMAFLIDSVVQDKRSKKEGFLNE